jgi:hypothetical protein
MDNYDLLSIAIENDFLKKNAIRWPSQRLLKCEAAFISLQY